MRRDRYSCAAFSFSRLALVERMSRRGGLRLESTEAIMDVALLFCFSIDARVLQSRTT